MHVRGEGGGWACSIVGGDALAVELAAALRPRLVLLLSSTAGVYTHPPGHPDARLLPTLTVSAARGGGDDDPTAAAGGGAVAATDVAAHDVTGGMGAKVAAASAAVRARRGGLRVLFSSIPAVGGWAARVGTLLAGVEKDGRWGGGRSAGGGGHAGGDDDVEGTWMVWEGEGGEEAPPA